MIRASRTTGRSPVLQTVTIVAVLMAALLSGETAIAGELHCNPRLLITNQNPDIESGSLASMCAGDPWEANVALASLGASDHTIRVFDGMAYVVHHGSGLIAAFDVDTAQPLAEFNLGPDAQPHDIAVIDAQHAYVTRHAAMHLLRLNLVTGEMNESVDLSDFAGGAIPGMSMMARDGDRLFIQLQESNVLAVFDVTTESLIDIDPARPGIQPIELQGTLPRYKMQIDHAMRRLYISASGGMWSTSGGIEIVDLDTLASAGFALENPDASDLGAFIMVSADRGYYIFHTDFAPSSHVRAFTIGEGPEGTELLASVGWPVTTSLAFDPRVGEVYFHHGGFAESGPQPRGVYVIDAETGDLLTEQPIDVGGWPSDLALVQKCPADLNGDGVVDVGDLFELLGRWGEAESFEPADMNYDGMVDVTDLFILLGAWGPCESVSR